MAHAPVITQDSLLSFFDGEAPAKAQPAILGATFDKKLDGERLTSQQRRVEELMSDGEWRTLHDIAVALRKLYGGHFPEASLSARLRDLRRAGYIVEHKRQSPWTAVWIYRAVKKEVAA